MKSNSPYPAGTICARDPTLQTCFDTGDSGSGLMMERIQGGYSWEGALSAYKGCDNFQLSNNLRWGENPGIFTQGSCYLPWIASAYNLSLGSGLSQGCRAASGDPEDVDREVCLTRNGDKCDFNSGIVYNVLSDGSITLALEGEGIPLNQCILNSFLETTIVMTYGCITSSWNNVSVDSFFDICANNCKGVRTSDIIAGGAVVLAATSVVPLSVGPGLGLSLLGLGLPGMAVVGVAGIGMTRMMCMGPLFCRVRSQCCLVIGDGRRGLRCPQSC